MKTAQILDVIQMLDKGRPMVIMSYEDYISKMKNILNDDKYCILCRDPTLKVEKITSTQNPALQGGHITQQLYDQLTPQMFRPTPDVSRKEYICDQLSPLLDPPPTALPRNWPES